MERGRRQYHDNLSKKFSPHSTEKLRRGTLLCFTKFLVSKKNMDKRGAGGREYKDFPSRIFFLTVPKIFTEEPICALESF